MKVLGISPLDKDASASLVEDGRVLFAAGEERFSRRKHHAGFPHQAIACALETSGTTADEIDVVAYAFLDWKRERELMRNAVRTERELMRRFAGTSLRQALRSAQARIPRRTEPIDGLRSPGQRLEKNAFKRFCYRLAAERPSISRRMAQLASRRWAARSARDHRHWHEELERGLERLGLLGKLRRFEHHVSHAANAYLASGLDRALIVTLDGYGSGLAGSISLGEDGAIRRLHDVRYPHSLGTLYETVTSSLGFHPDRHAGKIVGLAAYGDPQVLSDVLLQRIERGGGDYAIVENLNIAFSRHLAAHFPMIDVAAAYQNVLEIVACELVAWWARETGCDNVVLSGGVAANVKLNQRLHALPPIRRTFVYPNMGDGGCGTGLGLFLTLEPGAERKPLHDVYLGPEYGEADVRAALERADLAYERPDDLAQHVAQRIHAGDVVARFDGRMEYGPRALGNRSILYHGRDPGVNQWLNQRLGRTEFMPFAPVTLHEHAARCYTGLDGAEDAAEFMTITCDCTDWMKQNCPAAVHVDGTARPQLIRRDVNPGYYDIVAAYERLSGVPCLINTSFNMHEEPIVLTPDDAVRAFVRGHLDGLAIGPFYVPSPHRADAPAG